MENNIDLAQLDKLPLADQFAALSRETESKRQAEDNRNLERIYLGMREAYDIAEQRARRSLTSGAPAPLKFGIGLSHDYVAGYNQALSDVHDAAAPSAEQALRDTLIELTNTQRKLIDANAEIAALLLSAGAAAKTDHARPWLVLGARVVTTDSFKIEGTIRRIYPDRAKSFNVVQDSGSGGLFGAWELAPVSASAAGAGSEQAKADRVVEWSASYVAHQSPASGENAGKDKRVLPPVMTKAMRTAAMNAWAIHPGFDLDAIYAALVSAAQTSRAALSQAGEHDA